MPRGKSFETNKLDETLEALGQVAPKPKTSIKLKELIRGLKPKIKRLRSWGYSWAEIVELLKQEKIEITEDTLKNYIKTPRRKPKAIKQIDPNKLPEDNNIGIEPETKKDQSKPSNLTESQPELMQVSLQTSKDDKIEPGETGKANQNKEAPTTSKSPKTKPEPKDYTPIKITMRK